MVQVPRKEMFLVNGIFFRRTAILKVFHYPQEGATTLSIMTFSLTTLSITTFSITIQKM
jgi:hypothetical protein